MRKDERARRMPGHRQASASVTAALSTLPYPIATQEAAERIGDWPVPIAPGETVPLGQMLAALPEARLEDPGQAMAAVDRHWARIAEALAGASRKE